MEISELIRIYRAKKHISQAELAKILNVSATAISHWESGKKIPAGDTLIRIAKKRGITKELFEVENDELGEQFTQQTIRRKKGNDNVPCTDKIKIILDYPENTLVEIKKAIDAHLNKVIFADVGGQIRSIKLDINILSDKTKMSTEMQLIEELQSKMENIEKMLKLNKK